MSKQLDSILDSATNYTPSTIQKKVVNEPTSRKSKSVEKKKNATPKTPELDANLTITLPQSVKHAMRLRMAEDETGQETYRSLILKGLQSLGFNISDDMLVDRRRTR